MNEFVQRLKSLLGTEKVLDSKVERTLHAYDASRNQHLPDAVVQPTSTEDVSKVMKLADEMKISVTPRAAGTGLTGGAVPIKGGISLDMSKMNKIIDIDSENLTAFVEAGVLTGTLQREVEKKGLFYPPDPASSDYCTLGGNVAECAGGLRGLKYGVTRDYVLAIEVVLPNGDVIHTGAKTLKSVTGIDLTRLFVGSEGTLGIFTKLLLKLVPKPQSVKTLLASFNKLTDAGATVSEIVSSKIVPRAMELMEGGTIEAVRKNKGTTIFGDTAPAAALLIECDGDPLVIEKEIKQIRDICEKNNASSIMMADEADQRDKLWSTRRSISPSIYAIAKSKLAEDICIPRNKLVAMFEKLNEISRTHGFDILSYGHAGDGNLHVNVLLYENTEKERERGHKVIYDIFKEAIALGGTLSGEHGIGITKSEFMSLEIPPQEMNIMKKLKSVFDPNNILNPGKIYPD